MNKNNLINGRYRLDTKLGITNFSIVSRAIDIRKNRKVILKGTLRGYCTHIIHCRDCLALTHEATILALLKQSRIPAPRLLDLFHVNGQSIIAMTYIPGYTLEDVHRHKRLNPRQLVHIVLDVCAVVERVHQIGLVHHDLKPANIIVHPKYAPAIIDWGSAQRIGSTSSRRDVVTGTLGFSSLEQRQGEILPSNDVFALGKMLERLVEWPGPQLDYIIRRATASADQRYATVGELRHALAILVIIDTIAQKFGLRAI